MLTYHTLTSVFEKSMLTSLVNIGFSKTDVNVYALTSVFWKTDVKNDILFTNLPPRLT